jgi:hypothetical protein
MRKWGFVILAIVIALGTVAWYAFRPERLVVNQSVNEAFPGGQASSAQALERTRRHTEHLWTGHQQNRFSYDIRL